MGFDLTIISLLVIVVDTVVVVVAADVVVVAVVAVVVDVDVMALLIVADHIINTDLQAGMCFGWESILK